LLTRLCTTQAVLTVAFFLAAFFLGSYPGYILLFNLIFSYLWLVAVAFTASDFTHSNSALHHTVEAFSFIALYVTDNHLLAKEERLLTRPQLLPALQRPLRLASRIPGRDHD
jgi:integral membrane sensor domain MASE1